MPERGPQVESDQVRRAPRRSAPDRLSASLAKHPAEAQTAALSLAQLRSQTHKPSQSSMLGLQKSFGNQAVALMLLARTVVQRKLEMIGAEQVEVDEDSTKGAQEKQEAEQIIAALKAMYGLDLSAANVIEGIKEGYPDAPDTVKGALKARHWRMIELRAVADALKNYAPILGAARANSPRKDTAQEVTSVGKLEAAIDEDTPAGELDTTTLGEYFAGKKAMGMFQLSEGDTGEFPDEKDQLVGTFVHEIAHGLLKYAIPDFINETGGYWTDEDTKSGTPGVEAPTTSYGATNAAEDICETAMFYFVNADRLKNGDGAAAGAPGNAAPLRHAFMLKLGRSWLPPLSQAPQVTPTTGTDVSPATGNVPTGDPITA